MAQWGERSPPTNTARVQFQPVAISGLSLLLVLSLLQGSLFLRVLQYSSFHTKKTNTPNSRTFDQDKGPA